MNEPRVWPVIVKDRCAGHGMSLPSYELRYDGWEMKNPPKYVVDIEEYKKILNLAELANALISQIRPGQCSEEIECLKKEWADAVIDKLKVERK